jgi:hypothetical protein
VVLSARVNGRLSVQRCVERLGSGAPSTCGGSERYHVQSNHGGCDVLLSRCMFQWSVPVSQLHGARFRQKFTLDDAIGSHACSLEANTRVTNGIPLGSSPLVPVDTVNCVATLKAPTTLGTLPQIALMNHTVERLQSTNVWRGHITHFRLDLNSVGIQLVQCASSPWILSCRGLQHGVRLLYGACFRIGFCSFSPCIASHAFGLREARSFVWSNGMYPA